MIANCTEESGGMSNVLVTTTRDSIAAYTLVMSHDKFSKSSMGLTTTLNEGNSESS